MNNTDKLQIFVDIPNSTDLEALAQVLSDGLSGVISQLQSMKKAQGFADPAGRQRITVEAGTMTIKAVSSIFWISSWTFGTS